MKKKILSLLLAVAMLFSMAIPALAADGEETPVVTAPYTVPADVAGKIVILHTNDVHGAVENYAKVATLKKMFADAGAAVLVVDAGDFSQGETYVSVSQGKSAVELMNLVGYEAVAPGNHEFDYGYENLKDLAKLAQFPILAANIKADGKLAFGDHVVIEKGGKKIGLFGLDTPETATKAHPAKIKGVTFAGGEELYAIAKAEVEALQKEKVDLIVCLSHLGIDDESAANGNRSIDMLAKVEGIDLLIDGHSHSTIEGIQAKNNGSNKVGETVITSTGTKIANVGVVIIDGDKNITAELVPVEAIPEADATVAEAAKAVVDAVNELYGQVFAKSEVDLNGDKAPGNRTQETNLGDLICDAMVWQVTKDGGLEVDDDHVIALTNGGGIRAPIAAGDITRQDVNKVLPFGNTVATIYVTGTDLLEALEASTFCTPSAVGGFPQVSGIEFSIDTAAAFDAGENYPDTTYAQPKSIARVTIHNVNGKDFDVNGKYAVITNDFVAAGGDTYYVFKNKNIVDTGVPLDEALMAFITEKLNGVVGEAYAAPRGRIAVKHVGVEPGKWYTAAAKTVLDNGLMTYLETGFEPTAVATRGATVQALYNLEGKPEVNNKMATFPDVQGKSYENAVRWAEQVGITNGNGAGAFNGEGELTRAELVAFLGRYAEVKGSSLEAQANLLDYADGESLASWAIPGFQWAVDAKIISGKTGNLLAPTDTATRAELAQILVRSADFFALAAQ